MKNAKWINPAESLPDDEVTVVLRCDDEWQILLGSRDSGIWLGDCGQKIDAKVVGWMNIEDVATALDAINSCERAIVRVLERIRDDKRVRHLMGAGTEAFDRLVRAYALFTGEDLVKVCEQIIPGSASLVCCGEEDDE